APVFEIVIGAVAAMIPAFLVFATRVGTEQHAARLQRGMQLAQNPRQFPGWDVEQRRIGKYAVETCWRQVQPKKILLPHLAAAIRPRHFHEARGTIEPDRHMAKTGECPQIASRPAAKIQNGKRRPRFDMIQQRGDILAYVMILRTVAKIRSA